MCNKILKLPNPNIQKNNVGFTNFLTYCYFSHDHFLLNFFITILNTLFIRFITKDAD
jgi:hypothetical protein